MLVCFVALLLFSCDFTVSFGVDTLFLVWTRVLCLLRVAYLFVYLTGLS